MGDFPLLAAAARQGPGPVFEALHEASGDLDARSPQGFTPLSLALIVKNLDATGPSRPAGSAAGRKRRARPR
jgi:ankyrin repeat protein